MPSSAATAPIESKRPAHGSAEGGASGLAELAEPVEARLPEILRAILMQLDHRRPSPLERQARDEQLLRWALSDDAVCVQMLRFVAVLPTLSHHRDVARHLDELYEEVRRHHPNATPLGPAVEKNGGLLGRAVAYSARRNVTRMAERFLGGESDDEVATTLEQLRRQGLAATLVPPAVFGSVTTARDADAVVDASLGLMASLGDAADRWADDGLLDRTSTRPLPRLHLTLRVSSLAPSRRTAPLSVDVDAAAGRLRTLLAAAGEADASLQLAPERARDRQFALDVLEAACRGLDADAPHPQIGVSLLASHVDAAEHLARLTELSERLPAVVGVRLHEGPFNRSEAVDAGQQSRPCPVSLCQAETDLRYEQLATMLLGQSRLTPTFATHHLRQLGVVLAIAEANGVDTLDYEFELQRGVADELAGVLATQGHRVRIAVPIGPAVPGMAALAERMLCNPPSRLPVLEAWSHQSTGLAAAPDEDALEVTLEETLKELTMSPATLLEALPPVRTRPMQAQPDAFENEPLVDWSQPTSVEAMQEATDYVESELGGDYPLVIDGKAMDGRSTLVSRNPSSRKQVIGKAAAASPDQASEAVESAARAFETWSRRTADERAEYLEVIAAEIRNRRFELAAWLAFEAGKPWATADAEVAEAIDLCRLYAREARRMDAVDAVDLAGEENETEFHPRGVCVALSPWQQPLAVLTGMTAAALATGNTVVMKPSEQTPIVAAKLLQIMRDAGLPSGVANYVPGGDEVGANLVGHRLTALVAVQGSADTVQAVYAHAAASPTEGGTLRKVVAEVDGRSVLFIDDDADLDAAIVATLESALDFAGQSPSACRRVVVLGANRDAVVERLAEAAESMTPAAATDQSTQLGPVLTEAIYDRFAKAVKEADEEIAFAMRPKSTKKDGYFLPPHIAVDVPADHFLARDPMPGPLIVVQAARTFDDAIAAMNAYGPSSVAGAFSRSPERLARIRREVRAGTIVLNQPTSGLLVARQPFGGFALGGLGTRAGGSDYLRQFVVPVVVSENVARRGYLPTD